MSVTKHELDPGSLRGKLRVIVLSHAIAPSPLVGAKRFSFLAREFERRGVDVRVVTCEPDVDEGQDASLPVPGFRIPTKPFAREPRQGRGLWARVINSVLGRVFAPVGWEVLWVGPAVRAAVAAAEGAERGVIIGTVPPRSVALAAAIASRRLGWPLVLDYRDPWTAYRWPRTQPRWSRTALAIARRLEGWCLAQSRAVVLNTEVMRTFFEQRFPSFPRESTHVIPNGIDMPTHSADEYFDGGGDIVHAGQVYAGRSLLPVLRALSALRRSGQVAGNVRLVVYGVVPPEELSSAHAEDLSSLLEVRSRLSRRDLWSVLRSAKALLILSGDVMGYSIPYKTYDYLVAGRPILAVCSKGTALDTFIRDNRAGWVAYPQETGALERSLSAVFASDGWRAPSDVVAAHCWPVLAERYLEILSMVTRTMVPAGAPGTTLGAERPEGQVERSV